MTLDWCVQRCLAHLQDSTRLEFSDDPIGVLGAHLGMTVKAVQTLADKRNDGGACDGVSFLQDKVILYAPTPQSRRQNFTLAHELGHWLVDQADDVYDWLADQDDPGQLLETVCDRIAQALLLPDAVVASALGTEPVSAQSVLNLFASSQASRPVCAIALAKRLPALGAVVIIDQMTGLVDHSSVKPDPERGWPKVYPWANQTLAPGHLLRKIAAGTIFRRRMAWHMPWGTQEEFYVDALSDGRRTVAVLSSTDLWDIEAFHAPIDREFDTRSQLSGHCCGVDFTRRGFPCPSCGEAFCPNCGSCRCERDTKREVRCTRCFVNFLPHLVVGGLCVECRS